MNLDSRLIYISHNTYICKVKWTKPTESADSEWIYIGLAEELKKILVFKILDEHFVDNGIYLSHSRGDSCQTTISAFKTNIHQYFGNWDFTLWDFTFTQVIQFNKIGVLRKGTINGKY